MFDVSFAAGHAGIIFGPSEKVREARCILDIRKCIEWIFHTDDVYDPSTPGTVSRDN